MKRLDKIIQDLSDDVIRILNGDVDDVLESLLSLQGIEELSDRQIIGLLAVRQESTDTSLNILTEGLVGRKSEDAPDVSDRITRALKSSVERLGDPDENSLAPDPE